jgi:hypothetical protein
VLAEMSKQMGVAFVVENKVRSEAPKWAAVVKRSGAKVG